MICVKKCLELLMLGIWARSVASPIGVIYYSPQISFSGGESYSPLTSDIPITYHRNNL